MTNDDLNQISQLLDQKLKPIEEQLDNVEIKVELVNKKIEKAQEETIDALSELISKGFEDHEQRINKIEDTLHISHPQ